MARAAGCLGSRLINAREMILHPSIGHGNQLQSCGPYACSPFLTYKKRKPTSPASWSPWWIRWWRCSRCAHAHIPQRRRAQLRRPRPVPGSLVTASVARCLGTAATELVATSRTIYMNQWNVYGNICYCLNFFLLCTILTLLSVSTGWTISVYGFEFAICSNTSFICVRF